jgi:murein DD-endopeptidase MepM/ murein hydrolase activator NlpD
VKLFQSTPGRIAIVGAVAIALAISPVQAENINQQVQDVSKALASASEKIVETRKQLKIAQARLSKARVALDKANVKEATATAKYNAINVRYQASVKAYWTARAKVKAKQMQIVSLQVKVDQFASAVYQQGQTAQWEIILESETPADLADRMQTIRSVSQATTASLRNLLSAKEELKQDVADAQVERARMQQLETQAQKDLQAAQRAQDAAVAAKVSVDGLIAEKNVTLANAEKYRSQEQRELDRLVAEQERLSQLSNSGSHGSGDPQATGPLVWPVPGYAAGSWAVQHVGPRILSSGRHSCHTGQDIPAPTGATIVASGDGTVLFAGWNWGYGYLTLIDHGGGLVTAYAHQSTLLVRKGQEVTAGQTIGRVGNTGAFSAGAHLHYEVHVNGYNYDPMGWFGGSKSIVACAPTRGLGV